MQGIAGRTQELRLIVSTPATTAPFMVESSTAVLYEGSVTYNHPMVVNIPSELHVKDSGFSDREKGIRIYSNTSMPLFVLAEMRFNNVSYPYQFQTLENLISYVYFVTSRGGTYDNAFLIVGSQDNTTISVTPSQRVTLPADLQMPDSTHVSIDPSTQSQQLTLHKLQTLLVFSTDDLTGTKISSDKPLTVISGYQCAEDETGCKPLTVQVPPTATWGTKFLLTPFTGGNSTSSQEFKAVTTGNRTSFFYTCGNATLPATAITTYFQFNTDKYCYLEASKPILLTQLGGMDDSIIALVSPLDQYVHEIDFISLPTADFPSNYISLMVPANHINRNGILLDRSPINCQWNAIYNRSRTIVGYGCSMTVSGGVNSPTHHRISHTLPGGRLSVLVYGYSSESLSGHKYAYLSGQFFGTLKLNKIFLAIILKRLHERSNLVPLVSLNLTWVAN